MNNTLYSEPKKYAVLLSAYACEPELGSEAAVGWGWASHLAQAGCDVHVITRSSNRERIEHAGNVKTIPNLRFTYFDLPYWLRFWKKGNRGVHLYYLLWQIGAFLVARRLVRSSRFDIVHHVTYVTARFPSFMGLLGLPFIFGPLGGGEYAPSPLWRRLGWETVIKESLRLVSMALWRYSATMNFGFFLARRIFVTSSQTLQRLPLHAQLKTEIMLGIGWDTKDEVVEQSCKRKKKFEILFAGRFLPWKGMEYGLEAVGRLLQGHDDIRLTMIGDGSCQIRWKEQSQKLGLEGHIKWCSLMSREQFIRELPLYDVMLFPSLHDSGGMVVMEAMAAGLPVVCLDYGGPAVLVDTTCGFKVKGSDPASIIDGLHVALKTLVMNRSLGTALGQAGRQRVNEIFSWEGRVERMLHCYEEVLCEKI